MQASTMTVKGQILDPQKSTNKKMKKTVIIFIEKGDDVSISPLMNCWRYGYIARGVNWKFTGRRKKDKAKEITE